MKFEEMKLGKCGQYLRETYSPKEPISYAVEVMKRYIQVDINQDQFDALVSLICHLGEEVFASSIVLKALNLRMYLQAGDNFAYVGRMSDTESLRKKEGSVFNGCFG